MTNDIYNKLLSLNYEIINLNIKIELMDGLYTKIL